MGIRLKSNRETNSITENEITTDSTVTNNTATDNTASEHTTQENPKKKAARPKDRKQSQKTGILVCIFLVFLASVSFLSLYSVFQRRADSFRSAHDEDVMQNENFLRDIYKGNTILYKELQEQLTGTPLRYQDIYLSVSQEPTTAGVSYIDFGGESAGEYAGRKLYEMLKVWEEHFWNDLDYIMDYQIIDHTGDTMITNTGNKLSQLGGKDAPEELLSLYPYYMKMRYNSDGFLEHVWVKGEDADTLLRNVQRVMRSSYLERTFYDFYYADGYLENMISGGDIYYYYEDNTMKARIDVNNTPRDCTICYALTQEQKEKLDRSNAYHQVLDSWSVYRSVGVADTFWICLIILGVLALLMPLWKKYHLHELWFLQFDLEILLAILFVLFCFMGELETELIMYSMEGGSESDLLTMLHSYLPSLPAASLEGIAMGINGLLLFLMFGFWYIMVTGLGQVYTLGLKRYIKKRSLCYRIWHKMHSFGSRKVTELKEEILHVDLGHNMNKVLLKLVVINFLILSLISTLWFAGAFLFVLYSIVLYLVLKKYISRIQVQYRHLLTAAQSIADGNLQTEFTGDWGVFESYKSELAQIQLGFSKAVEEEVKSQRMRTELITNVSHDLKTPLTAITTYIELLQEEGVTEEQRREYLDVLSRKSNRLKILIEDLFEVSKATSGNVSLQLDRVDIGNLMRQAYLEYEDKAAQADLFFRFQMPEEKQFLMLDSQKTYRIFENLYINIIKYAMPHTRVYVRMERHRENVVIELKNTSREELNIAPENLTERFVRGDSSRNTEGSGLGLAIVRSFVELQNGKMQLEIDGDLFKVTIVWKGL